MTTEQPEALQLADDLDAEAGRITQYTNSRGDLLRELAAAELRRLHAENESLHLSHEVACSVIEGLQKRVQELGEMARENRSKKVIELEGRIAEMKEQMAAIGAGGVEPLRKRECLHQISEPAQPVGWAIFAENGNGLMWTQSRQNAEASAKNVGLQVTPLYAAQAAPVDAAVQRDADRYRWLKITAKPGEPYELFEKMREAQNLVRAYEQFCKPWNGWDATIDAARAAQGGA